jgi:hypothetical protein
MRSVRGSIGGNSNNQYPLVGNVKRTPQKRFVFAPQPLWAPSVPVSPGVPILGPRLALSMSYPAPKFPGSCVPIYSENGSYSRSFLVLVYPEVARPDLVEGSKDTRRRGACIGAAQHSER